MTEERLKEIEWLADDGPGSYTDEAYRSMPTALKELIAEVRNLNKEIDSICRAVPRAAAIVKENQSLRELLRKAIGIRGKKISAIYIDSDWEQNNVLRELLVRCVPFLRELDGESQEADVLVLEIERIDAALGKE